MNTAVLEGAPTQQSSPKAAPKRPYISGRVKRTALPLLSVAILIGGWQITSFLLQNPIFPSVGEIIGALGKEASGPMWSDVGITLGAAFSGLLIACIIAIPLGLLIGLSAFWTASTNFLIEFLRPIPPIALLPLAVLTLGIGSSMIIALVIFASIWPMLYQVIGGVKDRDPLLTDAFRVYGMSRRQYLLQGVVPQSLPFVITGLKISTTIALLVAVASEIVAGGQGLGFRISQMATAEAYPSMYALIVVAGLLGIVVTYALRALSGIALFWHESERGE